MVALFFSSHGLFGFLNFCFKIFPTDCMHDLLKRLRDLYFTSKYSLLLQSDVFCAPPLMLFNAFSNQHGILPHLLCKYLTSLDSVPTWKEIVRQALQCPLIYETIFPG